MKTSINIHHSAILSLDGAEQFNMIDEAHRERWGGETKSRMGHCCGYHYVCERSGFISQARNDDEIGAHNNNGIKRIGLFNRSANYYAIGICFAGNMSEQELTDEQKIAGYELIKQLQGKHNIPDSEVLPHRHYKPTQCPGNRLPNDIMGYLRGEYERLKEDIPKWAKEGVKFARGNKLINEFSGREIKDYELATILHRFYNL